MTHVWVILHAISKGSCQLAVVVSWLVDIIEAIILTVICHILHAQLVTWLILVSIKSRLWGLQLLFCTFLIISKAIARFECFLRLLKCFLVRKWEHFSSNRLCSFVQIWTVGSRDFARSYGPWMIVTWCRLSSTSAVIAWSRQSSDNVVVIKALLAYAWPTDAGIAANFNFETILLMA